MKKLVLLVAVLAVVFTGCKKKDKEEVNPYTGKFKGTFTTIGTSDESTTKESTVTISEGLGKNLLLNYVVTLSYLTDGRYEFDGGDNIQTSIIDLLFSLCGLSSDYFDGTIEKIHIDARFTETTLKMTIQYQTNLGVAVTTTFNGTKQE